MALEIAQGTFNCLSGDSGTEDKITGLSFQPKIVFFRSSYELNGTDAGNGISMGWGAATATDEEWAISINAEDNRSTTDCGRKQRTDRCILCLREATSTVEMEYSFNSFQSDGVRLNTETAPSGTRQVFWWAMGGSDLEDVIAFNFQIDGDGGTGSKTVTFPVGHQFEPDGLDLYSIGDHDLNAYEDNLHWARGFTDFTREYVIAVGQQNGSSASSTDDINQYWRNDQVMARCNIDGGTPFLASDCVATSTGFTWTIDQAPGGSNDWYVFGVAFKGPNIYCGHDQMLQSVSTDAITAPGFEGKFINMMSANWDTLTGQERDNLISEGFQLTVGSNGLGWCFTADDGGSGGDTECESLQDTDHLLLETDGNGAKLGWAQISSWDANGFTYSQIDAASYSEYYYYMLFGANPSAVTGHPWFYNRRHHG